MYLSKIVVLVAHGEDVDVEKMRRSIDCAIGQQLFDEDREQLFYEVRHYGTKEVTLGSIDFSLEEGAPLVEAEEEKATVQS